MEKGKPRIKRKSIDETEKEEPEKVNQKLQKEPQKNSKRKLDTDSKDEQHKNITTEGRRKSESLEVVEVSKSSRNPSQEKELESSSTNTDQKKTNHPNTNGSAGPDYKNTRLVESNTNSSKITSRTLSTESKRELYKNSQSMAGQKVLEMLENFEDEVDLTLFKFVSSVANGTINPVTSVDALRTKFHGVSKNSTLVFKVLDLVSFFLDDAKKKQNLLLFLESLENFGLVSSMEIISVIDPAKLDSCNYSEGLVKISIRERTKNNYVLKIYNLFRESYHGYTALSNYLSSLVDRHGRNGLRFDVVQRPKQAPNKLKELDPDTVVATVNKISGMYKLCPIRTLYEVLKWLVLTNHSDEFVMKILKSYPSKISYVVLLYLKNNYQNKNKLLRINEGNGKDGKNGKNGKLDGKNGKLDGKNGKDGKLDKLVDNDIDEIYLNGYSNDNIYKIAGMLISEKLLKIDVVYNYLDPSDELLSNISNHFLNVLKTSPNKDTRDNLTIPIPLLKKLVTSHLNLNCLNPNYKRSTRMKDEQMNTKLDKEHINTKLDKENKIRKTSLTLLENMINKYESNDYSILLKIDNYHYLKECIYLMESGKFLVLSSLLNQCTDFEGELWDICYSYILHLYTINYPIFLNTSVTISLTNIMNKILNTSVVYRNIPEGSREIDLDNELIIIKKLEYYLKFVGFRCSENIIMFNNILTYLQIILTKINKQTGDSGLSTVDSDLEARDSNLSKEDSNLQRVSDNLSTLRTSEKHLLCKRMIKKLLYKYIIFSIMNCCEGNFQISDRIWNILKLFTTLERYQIYSKTLNILNSKQQINEKLETTGVSTNKEAPFGADGEGVTTNSVGVSTEKRNNIRISNEWEMLYYNYQIYMIKKLYEGYNYKLKNIFKKITFELLKSIKSPTIRSIVSIITAISAINPFSVSILIIKQSELFNNLLLPLCELTKYFLSYTIDIFIYQLTINLIYLTNTSTNNTTGKVSSIMGTGTVITNTTGTSSTMGTAGASTVMGDTVTYMKEYSLSKNRLEDNNNIIEEENNKMYINSIILCKIYKRHTECDIIPIITILILLLNFSISNHLILCRTNQPNILNHTVDNGDTEDSDGVVRDSKGTDGVVRDSEDTEDSDGVGVSTKGVSTRDIKDGKDSIRDSKDIAKGSMSNVSTLGPSTVTEGKGANSTLMECTTENNTNKIAIVTNSRESSTFTKDIKDTKEIPFGVKEPPLGAVGTGCREPHSVTEIKIIGICIENYYNIIYIIYNVLDYLIRLIEIIGGMIDVDMNKMTQEQLLCQCGSYSLKNESITNLDEEINKKSLIKVICRPFFINSLVIVLGRLINELLYDSNFNNCKLLLSIVDKFNNLLILLINFLQLNQQTFLLPNKQLLMKFFTLNQLQFINTVKCTEFESTVGMETSVELGSAVGPKPSRDLKSTLEPKSTVGPHSSRDLKSTLEPKPTLQPKSSLDLQPSLQPKSSLDLQPSLHPQPIRFKRKLEFPTVDNILDDNFIGFINNLNIYDIYTPVEQYDNYITKLTSGVGNTVRRIKRIKNRITILEMDKNEHIQHTNMILTHLKEVLKRFVKNDNKVGPHITMRFITRIIFPRIFVSELNALFCCKIVDTILENKMNYFNYFDFVNCYTKMLIPMISSLTEREVISLSIFFNHSFQLIKGWVNDREAFEKLVYDNPCFCTTFKFQPNKEFKYQQLLQVIKKWEYFILLSVFSSVTGSGQTATNINKVNSTVVTNNKDSNSTKDTSNKVTNTKDTNTTTNTKDSKANKDTNSIKEAPLGAGTKDSKSTSSSTMGTKGTMGTTTAGPSTVTEESPIVQSWIEIKNVIIFLNKVSNNFPITINSSLKVLNFLKNVLKLAKQNNWQDVTVSSNTLIKLIQMYQNQNKYITINIPNINTPGQTSTNTHTNITTGTSTNTTTSTPTNTSTTSNTPNIPSKNTNETISRRNSDTSPKISEETTKRNLEESTKNSKLTSRRNSEESTKGSDETKRSSEESPKSNSKETTAKNSKETTPKNKSNETSPKKSKETLKGTSKDPTKGNSKEPTPRTTTKETLKTTSSKETPKTTTNTKTSTKDTPKSTSKDTPKSTTKDTPKTPKAQNTT